MSAMETAVDSLPVFRSNFPVGTLRRSANGCSLEFALEFVNSGWPWLSLCIKKTDRPYSYAGGINLAPFFAGLLPEGIRLKALLSNMKTSADDYFSLLAACGSNVIGDVHIGEVIRPVSEDMPRLRDINFHEYLQQLMSANSYRLGEDVIPGVQEKLSASMISFPLNIAGADSQYIVKLSPSDKPGLVLNEFYCMQLAARCGIKTCGNKIVKDAANNEGLLVRRFDREWDAANAVWQMHHQEDACQFLDRFPHDKYRITMAEIASGTDRFCPAPQAEIVNLLRLYCFCYLVGNGDLHAKNISLMVKHGESLVTLTPAYDIICTYIYGDHHMALKLDGYDDNIRRSRVIEFGTRHGIPESLLKRMLDQLLKKFTDNMSLLQKIPMAAKSRAQLDKVIKKRVSDLS